MTTHCNTISETKYTIPVEKKHKWFTNFFITLLNDLSHKYITEKNYKNDTFQDDLKDAILNNKIEDYFKDEITKTNVSKLIKTILGHKKNADLLFDWMKDNNYINFFFFPYFIKFLNFKCITFEYYENTLYGGIYNYLKKKEYANKKYNYIINNYSINQSSGFDYEYSANRYPEFLVVNLWDNNDNLANLSTIKDEPKLENIEIDKYTNTNSISTNLIDGNKKFSTILEYNGYKYYLKSCLLDNYNTNENDMVNLGKYINSPIVDYFPIISSTDELTIYNKNFESFNAIFDAAAIGQYLGGIDKKNDPNDTIGFINETCVIKYNNYSFYWIKINDLWNPYIKINNKLIKIINLHIHSKLLDKFTSDNPLENKFIYKYQ